MTKSAPKYETKIEIEVPQASYTNEPFDAAAVKDMLKKAGVDVKTVTVTDITVAQPGKADAPPAKTGSAVAVIIVVVIVLVGLGLWCIYSLCHKAGNENKISPHEYDETEAMKPVEMPAPDDEGDFASSPMGTHLTKWG